MADAYRLEVSAFPTTGLIDNFNRADENPLSDGGLWTTAIFVGHSALQVLDNQVVPIAAAGSGYRNTATFTDVEVFATVSVLGEDDTEIFVLMGRIVSPGTAGVDGYGVALEPRASGDAIVLYRFVDSIATGINSILQNVAVGDSIGLRVEGTTVEVWWKPSAGAWTFLFSGTDATIVGPGNIGIYIDFHINFRGDDFGGGSIVGVQDRILLEDGTGVLLLEQQPPPPPPVSEFRKIITMTEFLKSDVSKG